MPPKLKLDVAALDEKVLSSIIDDNSTPEEAPSAESIMSWIIDADSTPEVAELDESVLRWTIDDVTSPDLFRGKVGVIPMEFQSTEEYLGAFRVPLLEEVRAQLHQALGKTLRIQNAGHRTTAEIKRIERPGKAPPHEQPYKRILELFIRSKRPLQTTDLILLRSTRSLWNASRGRVSNAQSDGISLLACVVYASENSPTVFVTVYVKDKSPILSQLKVRSVWYVVVPGMSITPARRIWNAISAPLAAQGVSPMSVTHGILRIDPQVVPRVTNYSVQLPETRKGAETLRRVQEYSSSRGLNESQSDVVKGVLAALLAEHAEPHVRMVQGPPGTGKTSMLVTLISVLGCLKLRTLVSAPTNAAVLEISTRLMRFFDASKADEMFFGFCSRHLHGAERCFPISVRDVVLLGSKERMHAAVDGSELEKLFLHGRITRLEGALSYRTGWKTIVEAVVQFLTAAPALFEARAAKAPDQSKPPASRDCESSASGMKDEASEKWTASFWSFARKSTIELGAQMLNASLVLTTELPMCHLDTTTGDAMIDAANRMASLVQLMPAEAPAEPASWFSTTTASDTLPEALAGLNLSSGSSSSGKTSFRRARGALLEALWSRPGCSLFATKWHSKRRVLSYAMLKEECLKNATLVFSTVSGAGAPQMAGATFKCAIIDEASQLVEAETTIITRMAGLKQLILVGDHKQLPATVISKVAEECGYKRSLFDRLQTLQHGCRHMLDVQYRMKPALSRFPNSQFYEGKVQDGPNVMSPAYGIRLHDAAAFGAYAFLDCRRGAEVAEQRSWKNSEEVEAVMALVTGLGRVCAARNIEQLSVGIISPYAVQVEALKQSLKRHAVHQALQVEVKSVDGFQGNERDVIIFSAVRSNRSQKIGFVEDCRRLNVAITRGRFCVWIVGNARTLSGGGEIWKELVADAKARRCFYVLQGRDRGWV